MKILLLGADGQVGWELRRSLAPLGDVIALNRAGDGDLCGDLERPAEVARSVTSVAPDVVVNAAAYTAVDAAETDQARAHLVNADALAYIAKACAKNNALLVHYSTDYVFDGEGQSPWRENDTQAPLNAYGLGKWQGEQEVRMAHHGHLIFRTQWVYASRGKNFIRTMLRLALEKDLLKVISDQVGAPTGADLIADVTAHAIIATIGKHKLCGTYHLVASGETTWFEYARLIISTARTAGWPVTVADEAINPVPSSAFETAARRPHNSRLSTQKLEQVFGLKMPAWQQGVLRAVAQIMQQETAKGFVHE